MPTNTGLTPVSLPAEIRSRMIAGVNGLDMHVLETGHETGDKPLILLLHGFPELSYSWRKIMLPLARLGYHVVAPDQRGYGRTLGWSDKYDDPLILFSLLNLVEDASQLVERLGHSQVHCVIGHDFGSPVAAYCGLMRPDIFQSVIMMSAPFGGPPASASASFTKQSQMDEDLASLSPPRKHYQSYYSTPVANLEMLVPTQGLHTFLRAYYHFKSADWKCNRPFRLQGWDAAELAKMPTYYIMDSNCGMAETVAPHQPSMAEIKACDWLTETELAFYTQEFGRTGFQGGLQWYRCSFDETCLTALSEFHDKKIRVPSGYIAGAQDWGIYQVPGAFEAMQETACVDFRMCQLIEGAGHWVQQEKPDKTLAAIERFLNIL